MTTGIEQDPISCDLAVIGGRVIDPESGLDAHRNVAITEGKIAAVTRLPLRGRSELNATGHVVAPGWIDLHSHAQSVAGGRLQAHDGVTTALDLEGGLLDVEGHYRRAASEGRATNYGFSTSWQQARMAIVGGLPIGELEDVLGHFGDPAWQKVATPRQGNAMIERLASDLADGAIGIGVLMGYAPSVDPGEYIGLSRLAARTGTATFTHARDLVEDVPGAVIDGAEEVVNAAQETGARSHYCHINSTSLWHIDRVRRTVERAQAPITTEAYPYGAAATSVSADFLAPERLAEHRLDPGSLMYTRTGERINDVTELERIRRDDPGAVVIVHYLDEAVPEDAAVLERALIYPGTVIGSDAMPLLWEGATADPHAWPPPPLYVHPRGAGTFSRFIRRYVRELGRLDLVEAVTRCSLGPARVLESFVPAMRRKGRVQVGCDADLVVFDPNRVTDRATYALGTTPSSGYAYVMVGGVVVVDHDELRLESLPGRPIRARA